MTINKQPIQLIINGEEWEIWVDPGESLLKILRERIGLLGTKEGCGHGDCGACTVLLEGKAVNSCLVPAGKVDGQNITTIEGLSWKSEAHPLQEAFVEAGAIQCGYCTPGMLMSAYALLQKQRRPDRQQIKQAISGNLCRCTGYTQIEEAVLMAAARLSKDESI